MNDIISTNNDLAHKLDNSSVLTLTENDLRNSVIGYLTARLDKLKKMSEDSFDTDIEDAIKKEKLNMITEHRLEIDELIRVEAQEIERKEIAIRLKIAETESILGLFKATNNLPSPILQARSNDANDPINKAISGLPANQVQLINLLISKLNPKTEYTEG